MGKILIIKGADFSAVALGKLTDMPITPEEPDTPDTVSIPTISLDTETGEISLSADTGATIYYTTNGSNPTTSSAKYTKPFIPASSGSTCTVKAIAYKDSKTSNIPSLTSTIDDKFTSVQISTSLSGTVRYSLDGFSPTASSPAYAIEISITNNSIIKAAVFNNADIISEILTIYK